MWIRLPHIEALDQSGKICYNLCVCESGKAERPGLALTFGWLRISAVMDASDLTERHTCTFELNKDAILPSWLICGHLGVRDFIAN